MAWTVVRAIPPRRARTAPGSRTRCVRRSRTIAVLSPDADAAATATARVSQALGVGGDGAAAVTTVEVASFLAVKGVAVRANLWERAPLVEAAKAYVEDEVAARRRAGHVWDALDNAGRIRLLHRICNGEGDATYLDPVSGYTVFSFFAHLKRGNCCGVRPPDPESRDSYARIHRCRHCPYADDGHIANPGMSSLKARIPVVELARTRSQEELRDAAYDAISLSVPSAVSNAAVATQPEQVRAHEQKALEVDQQQVQASESWQCEECADQKSVTCTRCNGWMFLVSPASMLCPQCNGAGSHPCLVCTPWRPPPIATFYD